MDNIYLDMTATTPLSEEVITKMEYVMRTVYGNPSSLHSLGLQAEKTISEARANVFAALGRRPDDKGELIFTSCGTESNNTAILGCAHAKKRGGRHIICGSTEHPSVLECMHRLEDEGFSVTYLSDKKGRLDIDELKNAVREDTLLVTHMLVNNETGALYDIAGAIKAVREVNPQVIFHCDAVQAFGKMKLTTKNLPADLISVSGHKIHAPKGVGALYINEALLRGHRIIPHLLGGGQENGMRSGTENVIGIAAFGEAAKHPCNLDAAEEARQYLINNLPAGVKANIPDVSLPYIVSLTVSGIRSETMLHHLSSRGIFVSSGSACSSHHTGHGSYVLAAYGLDEKTADSTIRVSLDDKITREMTDFFLSALEEGIKKLVRRR